MSEAERPARILVVDDDPGVLRAVRRVLATEHQVHATTSPREGIDLAGSLDPDLAICDVRMPELDGFELLERLRDASPGIDVILMTGSLTGQDAHLVRAVRNRAFYFILKPFERDVLLALVDRCLETRRLRAAERGHLERIERELADARAFQRTMLPHGEANVGGVVIEARCDSCAELAGDLYDFKEADDGRVAFIVADVQGHGVPAALLTGTVKTVFRAGIAAGDEPGGIASSLARSITSFSDARFVTAFCGMLDPASGRLTYVNAGHPAVQVLDAAGTTTTLDAHAPLLCGAFPPDSWSDQCITLASRSRLFVYTDGLTETFGPDGQYPLQRSIDRLRDNSAESSVLDGVLADVTEFRGDRSTTDDITLMLLSLP